MNGDGLNNITLCFLKSPRPPLHFQLLQHCHWYAVCTTILGRIFSFSEFFSFRPSVIDIVKSIFIFFNCLCFCLFFSYILYLYCARVTDVYKNTSPFCFPLSHVRKPTNPLQYLSTRQNFSTCRRAELLGLGMGSELWKGLIGSVDSYSDCTNMQLLCLREREKFCSLTICLQFYVSE